MMENVPLMMAWLPTTDAKIATTSTGHLTLSVFITEAKACECLKL